MKYLYSDNAVEYTLKEFDNYCIEIRHEKTTLGTQQHNGVGEKTNRTILEKVKRMLKMANLPNQFWGEAPYIICYLMNRSTSTSLNFDILEREYMV